MNKKLFAGLAILLMLVVIASGCVKEGAEGEVKSKEEASKTMTDVSGDVEDISTTLEDISEGLASAVRPNK